MFIRALFFFVILFLGNIRGVSASQVDAQAANITGITNRLLPNDSKLTRIAEKLDQEKKNPFVPPKTYRMPLQKQSETPKFILQSIEVSGHQVLSEEDLKKVWQPYVGRQVDFFALSKIAYEMSVLYRLKGYFLSYVVVPEQKIDAQSGHVRLCALEGYVDRVELHAYSGQEVSERLLSLTQAFKKRPLKLHEFETALFKIRDLYPNSRAFFEPSDSEKNGAIKLKLVIEKKKTLQATAGVNNYGTEAVGPILYNVSGKLVPSWQPEHSVDVSYQQSLLRRELSAGSVGYELPVGEDGATVSLQGTLLFSNPTSTLDIVKVQKKMASTFLHPVIRSQDSNLYIGTELRYIDQNQHVKDFNAYMKERVRQLRFLGLLDWADTYAGQNSLQFKGTYGLPVLNPIKKNSPNKSRQSGSGQPLYFSVNFSRLQRLLGPFSVKFQADSQYAARNLLAIDRFYSNGPPLNGSYPTATFSGDTGIEAKIELLYDIAQTGPLNALQLFGYASQINIWNRSPIGGEKFSDRGKGLGGGVRAFYKKLAASLEYAYPVMTPVGSTSVNPRILFSLSGNF